MGVVTPTSVITDVKWKEACCVSSLTGERKARVCSLLSSLYLAEHVIR